MRSTCQGLHQNGVLLDGLNEEFATGRKAPRSFATPAAFLSHMRSLGDAEAARPGATVKDRRRAVTAACRALGQIPEKRVRCEFMKVTAAIGCPGFTRAHDLRHLFSTRAQEAGVNPILVVDSGLCRRTIT